MMRERLAINQITTPAWSLEEAIAGYARHGVHGVGVDPRCTMEDPDLYSHRREQRTGRQAGVIWLDPSDR